MPLVNIDLLEGRTEQDLHLIGDSVHQAMVEELGVPQQDGLLRPRARSSSLAETQNDPAPGLEPGFCWVGVGRFELPASSSRTKRAAKLRYTPPARTSPVPREPPLV